MASTNKALSHSLNNVYDLFDGKVHYLVPPYQRGYAWTNDQVGMLLDDLDEAFRSDPDEEYLLGQIIVCPAEKQDEELKSEAKRYVQWDLIDGQQRTTTMYLLTLALYQEIRSRDEPTSRRVTGLHALATHGLDGDRAWPKVRPASNGIGILDALVNGKKIPDLEGPTAKNLIDAWNDIKSFLAEFETTKLFEFAEYVQDKVVLIRLELDEAKHALRVFAKVNNRGLALDPSDLIKNYLFQTVSGNDQFEVLAGQWDQAAQVLNTSRLKKTQTMDFLLKLKAGIKTGKSVSTHKIFDSWSENLKSEEDVKKFAAELPIDAKTVKQISLNQIEQLGGPCDWNYFTGIRRVVQHFEVLLAGSHLREKPFQRLNRLVQDRMVLAVLSKTEKDFERLVHPWAQKVSELDSDATDAEIIKSAKSTEVLDGLDDLFSTAFIKVQALRYTTQSHQEILRYLLARSSKALQDSVDSIELPISEYMQTTSTKKDSKRGFDLDHIFPQSKAQFQQHWTKPDDWDEMTDEDRARYESKCIHSLGNLALLHPRDDREQSDSRPDTSVKQDNYSKSEIYFNRLFVGGDKNDFKSQHSKEIEALKLNELPRFSSWNDEAVEARAKAIWGIIRQEMEDSFAE